MAEYYFTIFHRVDYGERFNTVSLIAELVSTALKALFNCYSGAGKLCSCLFYDRKKPDQGVSYRQKVINAKYGILVSDIICRYHYVVGLSVCKGLDRSRIYIGIYIGSLSLLGENHGTSEISRSRIRDCYTRSFDGEYLGNSLVFEALKKRLTHFIRQSGVYHVIYEAAYLQNVSG